MSKVISIRKRKETSGTMLLTTSPQLAPPAPIGTMLHTTLLHLLLLLLLLLLLKNNSRMRYKSNSKLSPQANDTAVQKALKQLKRLEIDIAKFNSKTSSISKTNILRTLLLPYLRDPCCDLLTQIQDKKIYISLTSVSTNVFLRWWRVLLTSLTLKNSSTNSPQISSTDRNAYLEGISRIISRREWFIADPENFQKFQTLLTITLDYSIDKVQNLKILPLLISAFVGKVFAYSYFHLPMVSNGLLFLLNVKQYILDDTLDSLLYSNPEIHNRYKKSHSTIKKKFPDHLNSFNGISNLNRKQKFYINSVPPPKHPVKGITDPNGSWVRRWCSSDSDIFNSFFRHYITITNSYLFDDDVNQNEDNDTSSTEDATDLHYYDAILFHAPGFKIIMSHILHIFQVSISRIAQNNSNNPPSFTNMFPKEPFSDSSVSTQTYNDIYYNSIVKILKTCRDLKYSSNILFSRSLVKFLDELFISIAIKTSIYDYNRSGLILNIVYEFINHVDTEINWEFWLSSCFIMIEKTDHIQILLKNFAFIFNIWDMIPLTSRTSLASPALYNINKKISLDWISNPNETYKWNFSNWLVSSLVWSTFFNHWEPIVRTYYIKLIIWRLIGINNHSRNFSLGIEKTIGHNLRYSFDYVSIKKRKSMTILLKPDNPLVNRKFAIIPNSATEDIFSAIDSKGINNQNSNTSTISTINSNSNDPRRSKGAGTLSTTELRKTHPYEIFDEAIYSCSSLPRSAVPIDYSGDDDDEVFEEDVSQNIVDGYVKKKRDTSSNESKGSSLASSLGKILKILSTDDKRVMEAALQESSKSSNVSSDFDIIASNNSRVVSIKSESATSISTILSNKSGSTSPSIMSTYSTSYTDFSTNSLLKSNSSSSTSSLNLSDLIQPPELLTRPPNIIRPMYRFDMVVDVKSMNEKMSFNRKTSLFSDGSKSHGAFNHSRYSSLPKYPKIPSFAKFYEMLFCDEPYIVQEFSYKSLEPFSEEDEEEDEEDNEDEGGEIFIYPKCTHNPIYALDSKSGANWVNVAKSLNEWSQIVGEFETFMKSKVQDFKNNSSDNYEVYFKRSIPFLSVDSANELKFLNAG